MTEFVDVLAHLPGLAPAPKPGTPECDRLEREIAFAGAECETNVEYYAVILKIMVSRAYWSLGTRWDGRRWVFPQAPVQRG